MALRVLALLVLAACDGGGDDDKGGDDAPDDSDSPIGTDTDTDGPVLTGCAAPLSVALGSGTDVYWQSLADGDPVTIVHGPQGGWHVEVAGRVSAGAQEVSVLPKIVVPSLGDLQIAGEQQSQFLALAGPYDAAVCAGDFYGVRAFVDEPDPPPNGMPTLDFICSLEDLILELSVEVIDDLSVPVPAPADITTTTIEVVAQLDPSDEEYCASLP